MAQTGRTSYPYFKGFFVAQQINQLLGGAVVTPWEVDQIEDEWVEAGLALATSLPKYIEHERMVKNKLAAWRNSHPAMKKKN